MTFLRSAVFAAAFFLALGIGLGALVNAIPTPENVIGQTSARPSVSVIKVARSEIVESVIVSGTLVARDEVMVVPEVDGFAIVELLAEEGDRVSAGQILARLSRATLEVLKSQNEAQVARAEALIAQAKAQQSEAEANLQQAGSAFERTRALRENGNATQELYDQRAASVRTAEARLNASKHAFAMALADLTLVSAQGRDIDLKLARTTIKAPVGGIISRRNARLGAMAPSNAAEPLFRIIADVAIEFEAEIADVELAQLRVGQPVSVTPAGASNTLSGEIRLISPEVNRQSRLGRVRVSLAGNPPLAIGSFARGVIEIGRKTVATLPFSAIAHTQNGAMVQTVWDGTVSTKRVELGLVGDGRVEIVAGIGPDEMIVGRAGTFVRDGHLVTPVLANDGARR